MSLMGVGISWQEDCWRYTLHGFDNENSSSNNINGGDSLLFMSMIAFGGNGGSNNKGANVTGVRQEILVCVSSFGSL